MKCDKKLLINRYIKSTHKREHRIELLMFNWYLVLKKKRKKKEDKAAEEEEEEFEEVPHDWIRLASMNQVSSWSAAFWIFL